ncbi:hypothetical protein G9A89_004463 [Geosiphon pyriformis]|nr:hypothetical protein G9A89_004463 [Geosiphon pyriformis]
MSNNIRSAAAFVTHGIEANFGIAVDRTLLSTKTEAKAVLLALQIAVISEKGIELNINKMAIHTKISENEMADKLAKEATAFNIVGWAYNVKNISYISSCREVELDLNIRHFLNQQTVIQGALNWIDNDKVHKTVKFLDQRIDWKCTTKVWNWDMIIDLINDLTVDLIIDLIINLINNLIVDLIIDLIIDLVIDLVVDYFQ